MTCEDCMHCEICLNKRKHHIVINGFLFYFECEDIEKICSTFKDKTKYIELPCKVGDTVYIIDPFNGIYDTTLRNVRVNNVLKNNIFLTKSEAEHKLKELLGDN